MKSERLGQAGEMACEEVRQQLADFMQIGRASCRERVSIDV